MRKILSKRSVFTTASSGKIEAETAKPSLVWIEHWKALTLNHKIPQLVLLKKRRK
jgi:hypothetical protein